MTDPLPPAAPAPRPRRRWRRRLLVLGLLLVGLVVVAPMAVGLAPVRHWVAGKASTALGREVSIGGMSASWWGGIDVRDLEVHNPQGYQGPPLLAVDRVHVDVRWWATVTGALDAAVAVERPVVTLIRGADGRSNLDGLGGAKADDREPARKGPRPTVRATVRDGVVRAYGPGNASAGEPDVVDAITLDASLAPGGTKVTFAATARKAKAGGGDAAIAMDATLDADGAGPVRLAVPPLDLARLSKAIGAALGVDGVTGALEAQADVALVADGPGSGRVGATVRGLGWRKDGGTVSLGSGRVECKPTTTDGTTSLDVVAELLDLRATGFSTRDGGLLEPRLSVTGRVLRSKSGDLSFGDASAPLRIEGRALSGTASGALRDLGSDAPKADLSATLSASLSPTLGRLLGALGSPDDDLRGAVTATVRVTGTGGPLAVALDGTVKDLVVGGTKDEPPYREPSATWSVAATWEGASKRLTVEKGTVAADALSARVEPGFTVVAAEPATVRGDAVLDADLARLSRLRALVPAMASVQGGRVHATLKAAREGALAVDWRVTADDLAFTPGTLSTRGYLERKVVAAGRLERDGSRTSFALAELSSALLALRPGTSLRATRRGEALSVDAPATLVLDLGAAGVAFDKAMNVGPGQRAAGRVECTVSGGGDRDATRLDVVLSGRDVLLPGVTTPGTLDGKATVVTRAAAHRLEVSGATLSGFGLDVRAEATLSTADTGPALVSAQATWTADLAVARPLLGMALGLAPDATLSGRAAGRLDATPAGAGTSVVGTTTVERLRWVGARDPKSGTQPSFSQASVRATQRVVLDAEPGLMRLEDVRLEADVGTVRVTGSTRTRADEREVDLTLVLDGDLAAIATQLATMSGPDGGETRGRGRLAGRVTLAGPTGAGGRGLRVAGDVTAQELVASGLTVTDAKITVSRPAPGTPLTATVASGVNRGTLRVDATCDLGKGESPWAAKVAVRGLDTSPLVTKQGAGHALALVLPAIVPADATSNVLSGLLDADLDVRSQALDGPRRLDTLSGPGSVRMTQGQVKDSTLFGSLAGGGGKALGPLLALVPSVGRTLSDLSKAMLFQELSSQFTLGERRITLNPVVLVSPSVQLRFSGVVGYDGVGTLDVPLVLGGDAGKAIEPYVKDRTIPLKVHLRADGSTDVVPSLPKLGDPGHLLEKGKDVLDDLFKKKKPK